MNKWMNLRTMLLYLYHAAVKSCQSYDRSFSYHVNAFFVSYQGYIILASFEIHLKRISPFGEKKKFKLNFLSCESTHRWCSQLRNVWKQKLKTILRNVALLQRIIHDINYWLEAIILTTTVPFCFCLLVQPLTSLTANWHLHTLANNRPPSVFKIRTQ